MSSHESDRNIEFSSDFVTDFASGVHERTLAFFEQQQTRWLEHPEREEFLRLARLYLGEGKALRALCVNIGAYITGAAPFGQDPVAQALGVATEIYQASALVHDDVIDAAGTRRGHASLHAEAAASYGVDTGEHMAILVGDFLLSLNHLATAHATLGLDAEVAARVHSYMATMTAEVAWGQYLDILTEQAPLADPDALEEEVKTVIALKSGHYSAMRPLALGALVNEPADSLVVKKLEEVGRYWGIAFQMRDDALGMFGDEDQTGKPTGNDVLEGKRTVLIALALQRANAAEREIIETTLGRADATAQEVTRVRRICQTTGATRVHEAMIRQYTEKGAQIARTLKLDGPREHALLELGRILTQRAS